MQPAIQCSMPLRRAFSKDVLFKVNSYTFSTRRLTDITYMHLGYNKTFIGIYFQIDTWKIMCPRKITIKEPSDRYKEWTTEEIYDGAI